MEDQKVDRETPNPDDARAALVTSWCDRVKEAKKRHADAFKRMRDNMRFAKGKQWPNQRKNDTRYVANLTQRHIRQRTASLYAKNPKAIARRRPRMDFAIWDEKQESLITAMQAMAAGVPDPTSLAILQDYERGMSQRAMLGKTAKTLEILFNYYLSEQNPVFKTQAKKLIVRVLTCGVGYIKLGFQRAMGKSPDMMRKIRDFSERLAKLERLSADFADGEIDSTEADAEELRLALQALQAQNDVLIREGLVFDFPSATSIIPDPQCTDLNGFVGADWVAQEFMFSADKIQEIYGVDVGKSFTSYTPMGNISKKNDGLACVWEVYDITTGLVYTVCDGYPEFLEEPDSPIIELERFWPFFTLIFNDLEDDEDDCLFPLSDVDFIRHPQMEHNRARQGLREHRQANRPKYAAAAGALSDDDMESLEEVPAHGIVKMNSLAPGEKIEDKLQAVKHEGINPAMYDTSYLFDDVMRVAGAQEANFGGVSGASATESSIAEGSRLSSTESNVDDLDDMLTEIARAAGQVLIQEVSPETAKKIAGNGAVWPSDMSREDVASEIYLEVEAGSSGRPNKAQEVANFERMAPYIIQIPGINPEWLGREAIRRMDDRLDMTDAMTAGLPSITMMNQQSQPGTGDPATDPNQQGQEGGSNAEQPARGNEGPQPEYPAG